MTRSYPQPIARSIRIAVHRDINAGLLTCKQIAFKHDLYYGIVRAWMDRIEPQWVSEALRVREPLPIHAMPWVTKEMLTGARAPTRVRS